MVSNAKRVTETTALLRPSALRSGFFVMTDKIRLRENGSAKAEEVRTKNG